MDAGLREAVEKADVVAFDVFDTLLVRPFLRPEHLFTYLEDRYGVPGFAKDRISAERSARRRIRPEVSLEEIYSLIPQYRDMKDRELEAELSLCRPDPHIREVWDYARSSGKTIVAVSDMYLPSAHIGRMLEKNGWDVPELFVSNEYSLGKADGLYGIVREKLGLPFDRILMVGDNPHSDVSVPSKLGMGAYRWKPLRDVYRERYPREFRAGSKDPRISLMAGADMLNMAGEEKYWHMIGRRFAGPLTVSFALFVKSLDRDFDRLFFCSRDGCAAMHMYRALGGSKPSVYVYSSRFITECLSEDALSDKKKRRYIPEFLKACGREAPVDEDQLKEVLSDESRKYTEYLRQCVGDAERILLVDSTTMKFSAQKDMERRLPEVSFSGCYCSLMNKDAYGSHAFVDRSKELISWTEVNMCELFLSSGEPPVRAVSNGRPVFAEVLPLERERIGNHVQLASGEDDYLKEYLELFGPAAVFDPRAVNGWLTVLARNERSSKGPLWRMKWPSDVTNTVYVNFFFKPKELVNVAKYKVSALFHL